MFDVNENIRTNRKQRNWSQEKMAEQLGMSTEGYAKIERGESNITITRLKQIADLLQTDVKDLVQSPDKGFVCLINENNTINENSSQNLTYYGATPDEVLFFENNELKLTLKHKEEMLLQKEKEIAILRSLVEALQNKS